MRKALASITAVLATVVMLSGCGPASTGPATSVSKATSSPSPTEAAQTPAVVPSSSAVSTPPKTAPTATTSKSKPAADGTALAALARLTVKGRAPKTGYTRAQFGQAWYDTDHNGCDTRNDILRRDLTSRRMKNACKALAGTLAPDPYTGTSIRFVYGGASEVDIDHVVALSDAWQKGAATWPAGKRLSLANDPLNLLAVDASTNRSKGDGDAATWLPPYKAFRCTYVARQVVVKGKYGLWVTLAERDAMSRVLAGCPTMALPGLGTAPAVAALPRTSAQREPAPAPRPTPAPAPRSAPAPVVPEGGATALCNDGTLSFAAHHQGACSHHGGVRVFYK
ncbi:DUF1524 domain-containing protein [Aeromicrobium sp.]|uniref:GmrSD restriction endonuclease domain-containing protein n=1 Tax=Aeromicrobium sp. TaxID=1871063 RepID=UPI001998FB10|nr:DUF1524 domain-containing protein [Aeromicrobium sp.]MBC7631381.1 DUF1524 domain-containing protein [Aeromicrobium sp.]